IGQISGIIAQINDFSNTIASAVEEQTATTNEIARNVAEAALGSSQVAENITAVAQAARGTASGATDTQAAAQDLSRMAVALQKLVGEFRYKRGNRPGYEPFADQPIGAIAGPRQEGAGIHSRARVELHTA